MARNKKKEDSDRYAELPWQPPGWKYTPGVGDLQLAFAIEEAFRESIPMGHTPQVVMESLSIAIKVKVSKLLQVVKDKLPNVADVFLNSKRTEFLHKEVPAFFRISLCTDGTVYYFPYIWSTEDYATEPMPAEQALKYLRAGSEAELACDDPHCKHSHYETSRMLGFHRV